MERARDGSASRMRVAQEPAAEDGAAFAGSFQATFAADLTSIRSLHSQDTIAATGDCDREAAVGEITTRTWQRLLRTLCRRYAGRLIVRGTLLNHEELLVTSFRRQPIGRQEATKRSTNAGVRVGTRFVVRCVDAETSKIGCEVVARILEQDKWTQSGIDTGDCEPVGSCGRDQQEAWSNEDAPVLEQLDAIYGFDVSAFAAVAARESDHDEGQGSSQVDAMLVDFRAAQHLMVQRHIPHVTGFLSFAMAHHPEYATAIVTHESDARSYRSIDAAQKRRWADERFHYGQELEAKGRTKDAISEYSSCLKLNETHVHALAARGKLYLQSKQLDESIHDLERVVELDASFPKIGHDLLRAKGTLHHSRHVVQSTPLQTDLLEQKTRESDTRRNEERRGGLRDESRRRQTESFRTRSPPQSAERLRSASSSQSAKNLERDRLRELLEEENRKRDRRRKRNRYSEEDSDEERHRRDKRSSKKKSKKKKSKHKKKHRRTRRDSSSSSSGYSSGDSYARRSPVSKSSRRDKSPSHLPREEESVHPILLRQQHRIWK